MRNPKYKSVDEYIAECPAEARDNLNALRKAIRAVAPDAAERMDYFDMPGYSYPGYDYDGMFVWFSCKKPFVRLHIRPQALADRKKELAPYPTTKAIVSFPMDGKLPIALVKKLAKASLEAMKS